jgi:hypothetical protein
MEIDMLASHSANASQEALQLSVYDMTPGQIRAAFGKCAESFHKQRGLRYLRHYFDMLERDADYAAKLLADARHHLSYARAYK